MLSFLQSVVHPEYRESVPFIDVEPLIARAAGLRGEAADWASYMERKYLAALR